MSRSNDYRPITLHQQTRGHGTGGCRARGHIAKGHGSGGRRDRGH